MDRRLVSGAVAGLAAIVLATGGGTFAAFDDAADVPHSNVGAGVLQLELGQADGKGATLTFANVEPGDRTTNRLWVAANGAASTVPARLSLTVHHLIDTPGPCDVSTGKAEGDIASGITGCAITATGITGTPRIGTASRMLDVSASYVPLAVDPSSCGSRSVGTVSVMPTSGPGDLYAAANANGGAGTTVLVTDANEHPIALGPGQGVCLAVSAYWPSDVTDAAHASPDHPVDDAAQGDSFSVDFRFDLSQVAS